MGKAALGQREAFVSIINFPSSEDGAPKHSQLRPCTQPPSCRTQPFSSTQSWRHPALIAWPKWAHEALGWDVREVALGMCTVMGTAVLPIWICGPRKWGVGNGEWEMGNGKWGMGRMGGCEEDVSKVKSSPRNRRRSYTRHWLPWDLHNQK